MDEWVPEEWQETAFAHRHVHNRRTRPGGSHITPSASPFNPRKCFGTYSVSCPAARKLAATSASETGVGARGTVHGHKRANKGKRRRNETEDQGVLDIWRLTDSGQGLLGVMTLCGVMEVSVVLAGSRETMKSIVAGLHQQLQCKSLCDDSHPGSPSGVEDQEALPTKRDSREDSDSADDPESASSSETSQKATTAAAFEKNSFRCPKFWLKFQQVPANAVDRDQSKLVGGWGYLVFSGNDCKKFKGTMTCETLGWDSVPVTGWKKVGMSGRDNPFTWSQAL